MSTNDPFNISEDPFLPPQQRVRMVDLPLTELKARLFSDFITERSNIGRGSVGVAGLDAPMAERPLVLSERRLGGAVAASAGFSVLDSTLMPFIVPRLVRGATRGYRGLCTVIVTPPGGAVNASFNWRFASPYTTFSPTIGLNTGAIVSATAYIVDSGWSIIDGLFGDAEVPINHSLEYTLTLNPGAGWTVTVQSFVLLTRYTV